MDPGGGVAGTAGGECTAGGGTFTGNDYLIPLVGGSGGGGNGAGGGAGGGAILVASSTQITVNGTINANGGAVVSSTGGCQEPGGGSGGAIRLVSNTIAGSSGGIITAVGGSQYTGQPGSAGRVRLEAYTFSFGGSFNGTPETQGVPISHFNSFIPTTPPPSIQVTMIDNQPISANPSGFPDIQINTDQPVLVVITAHNVPLQTVPTVTILGDSVDQPPVPCPGGLTGTFATSTCKLSVTFAYGGSRGLVVSTWQNSGSK